MARVEEGKLKITETRERVVSAGREERPEDGLDALEYMEAIAPEDWHLHMVYLYRMSPAAPNGQRTYLEKLATPFDQEYLRQKYGGGMFRIFVKKGTERVKDSLVSVEGSPKFIVAEGGHASAAPDATAVTSEGAQVAREVMQLLREELAKSRGGANLETIAITNALDIQKSAFLGGIETIKQSIIAGGGHAQDPMAEITKQFMSTAITKMLNPSDPIETFGKMAEAMRSLNMGGGGGRGDLGSAIVQALPAVAGHIRDGLREWRVGMETQARIINAQRGGTTVEVPASPVAAESLTPHHAEESAASATAAPASVAGSGGRPSDEWIKQRIVNMFVNNLPGDVVGVWLENTAPEILDHLAQYTPEQLIPGLIAKDPILSVITRDTRLPKFLGELLEYANEQEPAALESKSPVPINAK
jgi:hypothetical protein